MDKNELPEQAGRQNTDNKPVDFSDLGPLFSADCPKEKNASAEIFSDFGPLLDGAQENPEPESSEDAAYTPRFAKGQEAPLNQEDSQEPYNPLFAQEQEEIAQDTDEEISDVEGPQEPYTPLFAQEPEEAEADEELSDEEAPREPYDPLFAQEQEEVEADEELSDEEAAQEPYAPLFAQEQEEAEADGELSDEEVTQEPYDPNFVEDAENPSVEFSDLGPLFAQAPQEEVAEDPAPFSPVLPGEAAWLLKKLNDLPRDSSETAPEAPVEIPAESPVIAQKPQLQESAPQETPLPTEEVPEEVEIPEEEALAQEQPVRQPQTPEEPQEAQIPENQEFLESSVQEQTEEATEGDIPDMEVPSQVEMPQKPSRKGSRPVRKGRPKRKKGEGFFGIPNLLVTAVWIGITILIGVTLGRMIWVCAADVLAFGRDDQPVTITIYEADTIDDIARKLHEGQLIHYPGLFKLYASLAVDDDEIQPGIWDLNTRYDYHALVSMMSPSSSRDVVELMIPEGYSCRQIFALLEENKICTATDLASYAANGELDDYWFLEGVPRGEVNCLEGFLFPDTYQFYKNDAPRSVLQKMLSNFETRFDEEMRAQINTLNDHLAGLMRKNGHGDDYIASHRFDIRDVINVASLIEKETSSAEEGYTIASVIYNRLFNWGDNVPYLNIDATIIYALGGKTNLTQEDLKVDSPYNTYTNTGLTPGPIANPGLASIRAALNPAETDYYYYVLDPAQGSHRFSTTYDEHKANIASIGG